MNISKISFESSQTRKFVSEHFLASIFCPTKPRITLKVDLTAHLNCWCYRNWLRISQPKCKISWKNLSTSKVIFKQKFLSGELPCCSQRVFITTITLYRRVYLQCASKAIFRYMSHSNLIYIYLSNILNSPIPEYVWKAMHEMENFSDCNRRSLWYQDDKILDILL